MTSRSRTRQSLSTFIDSLSTLSTTILTLILCNNVGNVISTLMSSSTRGVSRGYFSINVNHVVRVSNSRVIRCINVNHVVRGEFSRGFDGLIECVNFFLSFSSIISLFIFTSFSYEFHIESIISRSNSSINRLINTLYESPIVELVVLLFKTFKNHRKC